jgi:hypothetical protein
MNDVLSENFLSYGEDFQNRFARIKIWDLRVQRCLHRALTQTALLSSAFEYMNKNVNTIKFFFDIIF